MKPMFWNGKEKPKNEYLEYTCRFPGACQKHEFVGLVCFLIIGILLLISGIYIISYSVKPLFETVSIAVPLIIFGLTLVIGMGFMMDT